MTRNEHENVSKEMLNELGSFIKDNSNTFLDDFAIKKAKKKILIVDDQGFNIDALIIILKYSIKLKDVKEICDCVYDGK
jgi:PleD family two-component response regulator